MLIIRKEQKTVLEAYMSAQFRTRLLAFIRGNLREETRAQTDAELRKLIDEGITRSARYGITTERDISLYVSLMIQHSPHFEEKPDMQWAKRIQVKPELPGQTKLALITQMLDAQQKSSPTE